MSSCDWCTDSGALPAKIPTLMWCCDCVRMNLYPWFLSDSKAPHIGPKEAIVWDPCLGCGSGVTREHGALINPPTGCPVWKERQKALLYEKHDSKEKKKRQWSLAFSLFLLNTCSPVYFKNTHKFIFFYCKDINSSSHYHFSVFSVQLAWFLNRSKWGISPFCFLSYLSTSNF